MQFGCPGCKLTITSPQDGRVVIPAHSRLDGGPCCWGGRSHTVKAATIHSAENDKRRRMANENKKRGKAVVVAGSVGGPIEDAAVDAYRAALAAKKGKE